MNPLVSIRHWAVIFLFVGVLSLAAVILGRLLISRHGEPHSLSYIGAPGTRTVAEVTPPSLLTPTTTKRESVERELAVEATKRVEARTRIAQANRDWAAGTPRPVVATRSYSLTPLPTSTRGPLVDQGINPQPQQIPALRPFFLRTTWRGWIGTRYVGVYVGGTPDAGGSHRDAQGRILVCEVAPATQQCSDLEGYDTPQRLGILRLTEVSPDRARLTVLTDAGPSYSFDLPSRTFISGPGVVPTGTSAPRGVGTPTPVAPNPGTPLPTRSSR
jgi:hypothetical protein